MMVSKGGSLLRALLRWLHSVICQMTDTLVLRLILEWHSHDDTQLED